MADVVHWVETGEEDEVLDLLDAAGVPEAVDAARSAFGKEERQRSSIVTTLETLLEPFAGRDARGARPPFDPAVLLAGSDTLYLCAPAHDQRRLTPLFVGVLRAVLDTPTTGWPGPADRSTRRSSWCSTRRPTSRRSPTSTPWPPRPPATASSW